MVLKKFNLKKTTTFDSAHFLKDYVGKCANLHGHTWTVECIISPFEDNWKDFIIDFTILKEILEQFDHKTINDCVDFNPTCENLADYFHDCIKASLEFEAYVKIRLYESATSSVEVSG